MRRELAAVGATLTASVLVIGMATQGVSAAAPQVSQANTALRYLYAQVGSHGEIAADFGPGATEDVVISVADNGYDPATLKSASGTTTYSYLRSQESGVATTGGAAKYILAWVAAGKPAAIDATALVTRLNKSTANGGFLTPRGTFHNTGSETANAYSQSLSVLADVAAHHRLPLHATQWLSCAQRADGGFGYAISDAATSPPASCGDTSSDTNSTAIIVQALNAAGVIAANARATTFLHSAQEPDGGFGFATSGGSDPDSDVTVIQALLAMGQDPTGPTWTVKGGGNPLTSLESFADPQGSGGYIQPGSTKPDAFTTSVVPQALALEPYAATTRVVPGTSPPMSPPTPPPAASPTPATTTPRGGAVPGVPDTGSGAGSGAASWLCLPLLLFGGALLAASAVQDSGGRASRGRRGRGAEMGAAPGRQIVAARIVRRVD